MLQPRKILIKVQQPKGSKSTLPTNLGQSFMKAIQN